MTLKDILKKKNDVYSFFTEKDCLNAISDKDNKYSLLLCKIQTPEICKIACENSGQQLRFVRNQTPEICLAAVEQDGQALQYVHDKTPEICLAAVKSNGYALQYIEHQTEEIIIAAVKTTIDALKYVNETLFKPEPVELTVAEISELLGYEVKIVK